MLTYTTSTTTNRINPAELRYLRQAVEACTVAGPGECRFESKRAAVRGIVAYAWLHEQMNLQQEALIVLGEIDQEAACSGQMVVSREVSNCIPA